MDENTKKMLAGEPYCPDTAELDKFSHLAHRLCRDYTLTTDEDTVEREAIIDKLFPNHGEGTYIQGPMYVDYGRFTTIGKNFYANAHFTILDTCPVKIGDNVMCGPNVSLITAMHPLRYQQRNLRKLPDGRFADYEYGKPVTIGNNCWLATGVTICPGVTIGDGCVIGAGSVVTKDMPANSLVVGVPARAVRQISEKDNLDNFPY
jgi:maltose O-acetyltransferase